MLLKKSFPGFLLLIGCLVVSAQSKQEDVVYLKNGSIIRGHITHQTLHLENEAERLLKIELAGGSVFVFRPNEIDSITKQRPLRKQMQWTQYYRKDRGYRHITEAGLIYGLSNQKQQDYYGQPEDFGFTLHTVNGYQWWPYLFTGIGVGIDRYISYRQTFSPVYVRLASEFLKRKVTPYVMADVGYAIMWRIAKNDFITYKNRGGYYANAGGGLRIYTRSRGSVLLGLAYRHTQSKSEWWYTNQQDGPRYAVERAYHRMVFMVGATF